MLLLDLFEKEMPEQEGSYMACKFSSLSEKKLYALAEQLKLKHIVPKHNFHITVLYSRKPLPKDFKAKGAMKAPILAKPEKLRLFPTKDDENNRALVLELDCPALVKRHEELMEKYKLTYDFPEYIVHTTLSYSVPKDFNIDADLSSIKELEIVKEYSEALEVDWAKENS